MILVLCECDGLPPHDHFMGHEPDERGVYGPRYDLEDVGRVCVDWKAVAKALGDVGSEQSDTPERGRHDQGAASSHR